MSEYIETRKDIFRYNSQGQLELPELVAKTQANKIEFRANDGIYINDVLLSSGGGGEPVGNSVTADYSSLPPSIVTNSVPFGRTIVKFEGPGIVFQSIDGTTIQIPYTENPSKPFSGINFIVPIARNPNGKGYTDYGIDYKIEFDFDKVVGTFVLTIVFSYSYSYARDLDKYELVLDFLVG